MFLTPDALFVLVVDMFAYSTKHSREDALDQWLDILQSRVPGSIVLLVGTHSDVFGANSDEFSARKLSFNRGGSGENCCDETHVVTTCSMKNVIFQKAELSFLGNWRLVVQLMGGKASTE